MFSYSKTDLAPVWIDSKNYSSTFYLVTLSEEIDYVIKNGKQMNVYWTPKKS